MNEAGIVLNMIGSVVLFIISPEWAVVPVGNYQAVEAKRARCRGWTRTGFGLAVLCSLVQLAEAL